MLLRYLDGMVIHSCNDIRCCYATWMEWLFTVVMILDAATLLGWNGYSEVEISPFLESRYLQSGLKLSIPTPILGLALLKSGLT